MKVFASNGICIKTKEADLVLDPTRVVAKTAVHHVGVSHAHADHVRAHKKEAFMTAATRDLAFEKLDARELKFKEQEKVGDLSISLHDANHILGSSQFRVENSSVVCYTGDLRAQPSALFGKPEIVECDTLVIDATFGKAEYVFPGFEQLHRDIEKWLKANKEHNILFGAYALGKSQELVALLNDLGVVPVVTPRIAKLCQVYEKHGTRLGDWISVDSREGQEQLASSFVGIVPPGQMRFELYEGLKHQSRRDVKTALTTGWALTENFGSPIGAVIK